MRQFLAIALLIGGLQAENFYYQHGKKIGVEKIAKSRGGESITYYKNSLGKKIGVEDKIIFECLEHQEALALVKKYQLESLERVSEHLYIVQITRGENIFSVAQKLHEEEHVTFAHPSFIKERIRR